MLYNTKKSKLSRPDNINIEEIPAFDELGIKVLIKLLNDIYNRGYVPNDFLKSIFGALSKKLEQQQRNPAKFPLSLYTPKSSLHRLVNVLGQRLIRYPQ